MALARIDLDRKLLSIASVGNVEVRLFGSPLPLKLVVRRGIVGLNAPNPVIAEHPWSTECLLIIHSDGIRTHWGLHELDDIVREPPAVIARQLLFKYGKPDDDATVVAARNLNE